jgi:flavin-dependent dehydrogenase
MAHAPVSCDVVIVGGGPAGSACARVLVRGGLDVVVLDRKRFPRVKLCAGWLSAPVWDVLELAPREYPAGLWPWHRCHVQYGGRRHTIAASGHFIRRAELDHFLLRRSGATVVEEHAASTIARVDGGWLIDDRYRARYVVGAGGTGCPVARRLFARKADRPVAVQELELQGDADDIARARVGEDGEPELLLHDDLGGYSWNVPKGGWLNVGTGTAEPRAVLGSWAAARAFFLDSGHVPASAGQRLEHMEGHSYHLFEPGHLGDCHRDGAFLVGDALGLAHPLTAEGILPAVLSGRVCAEAILAGAPASYRARLEAHPVMQDYALARELLRLGIALRDRVGRVTARLPRREHRPTPRLDRAVARGFAWMFSGRPIPGGRILRGIIGAGRARA